MNDYKSRTIPTKEPVIVSVREWQGVQRLDIRHYFLSSSVEKGLMPTTKEISVPMKDAPAVIAAILQVIEIDAEKGPATFQAVQTLLDAPILYRIPTAGRLVRLKNRFCAERLEAACRRALAFDDPSYKTVKRILVQGLEAEKQAIPVEIPHATAFARSAEELVAPLAGVQPWN